MLKVTKYLLPLPDDIGLCALDVSQDGWILDASVENDRIYIYAMINELRHKMDKVQFLVVNTDQTIYLSPARYLNTVRFGNIVKHVFIIQITSAKSPVRDIRDLDSYAKGTKGGL